LANLSNIFVLELIILGSLSPIYVYPGIVPFIDHSYCCPGLLLNCFHFHGFKAHNVSLATRRLVWIRFLYVRGEEEMDD